MTVKELIDKLQQFDEDKLVLVEDTGYKEFQAADVEPMDDKFVIITTKFLLRMSKFIGVKMIEAVPMTAREANDKGHRIGNHSFEEDGYEVTYPDGYKSWSPAKEFEKAYYKLEDPAGDVLKENDIKRFIKGIENVKVGTKTTNTTLTCLTGFEVHGQAACVKPENFDLNVGSNYARIKAEDKIWEGLGFVLQWAKYGLKK